MKMTLNMSAVECTTVVNNAIEVARITGKNTDEVGANCDELRNMYDSGKTRNFAGGKFSLSHEDKNYIAELSVEDGAMVELIHGFTKTLIMMWPIIAPILTLPGTIRAIRATMKDTIMSAFQGFTEKYEKPTTYSVATLVVDEIDMRGVAIIEMDGYNNPAKVRASRMILTNDSDVGLSTDTILTVWKKAAGKDCRKDGYTTREEAEAAFDEAYNELLNADLNVTIPDPEESAKTKPLTIFRKDTHEQVYPFQSGTFGDEEYAVMTIAYGGFLTVAVLVTRKTSGEYSVFKCSQGINPSLFTQELITKMVEDKNPAWTGSFWEAKNWYDQIVDTNQN